MPKFTGTQGLPKSVHSKVCPVSALKAYCQATAGEEFLHQDSKHSFKHVWMSQVPVRGTSIFKPVGAQTCSRWMRTVMQKAGVSPEWTGGSIRMAGSSKAIDEGVNIDVVMAIGRWSSWRVFRTFYDRSRLNQSAPLIGETSLA